MMKLFLSLLILSSFIYTQQPEQTNAYQYFTDITKAPGDKITIEVIVPKLNSTAATFLIPAYTTGSYKTMNFGRFVSGLKAFDMNGNELQTFRSDTNAWDISGASALYKVTYRVDDTFDDELYPPPVFEPSGTNFEEGKNFVFNNYGIFGYIEGLTKVPVTLSVTRPSYFYATTTMNVVSRSDNNDVFSADDFFEFTDNPIMFCQPDTASIALDSSVIMFSVYSEKRNSSASKISAQIKDVLKAHRNYLGGSLPVKQYAFIFYLYDTSGVTGASGAHEHGRSSFYFMPDAEQGGSKEFYKMLESVCSHEFYHIITPLNLRSTEVADFDFNNPRMSEHLWLYEGVTEYSAHFIMLRAGMIDFEEFCKRMQKKMNEAESYDDKLPFTVMSRDVYGEHGSEYLNVYEKGALIGLCLDVLIRENSGGEKGLQDALNRLLEKYGKDKPFRDEDLFSEFESVTSPAIGDFLRKCVSGPDPLPFKHIAEVLGAEYSKTPYYQVDFGDVDFKVNSYNYRFYVGEVRKPNKFFNALGLKPGDEIVTVNDMFINILNIHNLFGSPENSFSNGDSYEMKITRLDKNGKEKLMDLEAKVSGVIKKYRHTFEPANTFTDKQTKFRETWLGHN